MAKLAVGVRRRLDHPYWPGLMSLKLVATRRPQAILAGAGALATIILCAGAAHAGTVQIKSCGDAPAGGADTAWQPVIDNLAGFQEPAAVCPPTGVAVGVDLEHTQILGRSVWTKLMSGVAPVAGERAEMRFTAPAGTTISAVSIKRDIGMRNEGYYVYGRTDSSQLPGETCLRPGGAYGCSVGGYGAGYTPFTGLNASFVAWGFECGSDPVEYPICLTGATLHEAWAHIYAATVTLTDNEVPTAVSAGGSVTTGGWKRGSVAGTISGNDNLGIRNVRWYADDALVSTSGDRTCDYSTTVPCSNASSVSYALNTSGLADGTRHVQAAVIDPAGNETKGTQFDVKVDNTAPPAPSGLSVTGGGSDPSFSATWTNPAADGGAPYVSSAWQACVGTTCTTGTGGLTSGSGTVPAGAATIKVWLVDAAGNGNYNNAASGSVTYLAPSGGGFGGGGGGGGAKPTTPSTPTPPATPTPSSAPSPPSTPTAPNTPAPPTEPATRARVTGVAKVSKTGRLTVDGRISRAARGKVVVTYRGRIQGAWATKSVKAQIRAGRYHAVMRLPSGWKHARGVKVTARYAGSRTVMAQTKRLKVTSTTG